MPGVTKTVVVGADDLEIIRADVAAGRMAAVTAYQVTPAQLGAARAGAKVDRERRDLLLELIRNATRVTFEVPENAGGEG